MKRFVHCAQFINSPTALSPPAPGAALAPRDVDADAEMDATVAAALVRAFLTGRTGAGSSSSISSESAS